MYKYKFKNYLSNTQHRLPPIIHASYHIQHPTSNIGNQVSSLQALLRKAFRSPRVLVLGDFGIFCLFLSRASREVKISRKCLTCLPKQRSSATGNNRHRFNAKKKIGKKRKNQRGDPWKNRKKPKGGPLENQNFSIFFSYW